MTRDYAAEMRAVIDAETGSEYSSPAVAARIVEKLRASDPGLLAGWLDAQAITIIRQAINHRDSSARTRARHVASRSVFAAAAAAHEDGDDTALDGWLNTVHALGDGQRKRLADMTADELLYAADDYAARVRQNRMAEAFLRALAREVGSGVVADRFTGGQLAELWGSISE